MKITATAFLVLAALMAPSPVSGYESMIGDKEAGHRRLGWSWYQDYYKSLYYRCCNTAEDEGAGDGGDGNVEGSRSKNNEDWRRTGVEVPEKYADKVCKCPVRGSATLTKSDSTKSYFDKWQEACEDSIPRKAGL